MALEKNKRIIWLETSWSTFQINTMMGALTPDAVPLSPWQLRLSVKSKVPVGHKPATSPMQFQTATTLNSLKINFRIPKILPIQPTSFGQFLKNYELKSNFLKES